ncbi:hypothetical protein B0H34DRAFT_148485 [Crassisporium funariophilum]|nr:hypothetical protein B0H34DRAFT_148485 [Crassisporium funariophilum]
MMQKYGQINMSLGKMKRTYVKKAVPEDDQPHFIQYATDLANVLRNIIFVVYPASKKQDVLQLLEEHITENLVKVLAKITIVKRLGFPKDPFCPQSSAPFSMATSRNSSPDTEMTLKVSFFD